MDQTEETGQRQVGGRQWNSFLDINSLLMWDETIVSYWWKGTKQTDMCLPIYYSYNKRQKRI